MNDAEGRIRTRLRGPEKTLPHQGSRLQLLRQIDPDLAEVEFPGIVGASGSGKLTSLNVLGMFGGDFEGEYRFADRPVPETKPAHRRQSGRDFSGFVFQQDDLLEGLSVAETPDVPMSYRTLPRRGRRSIELCNGRLETARGA